MAKRNIFRGLAAVLALGMCMTGLAGCGSEKRADGKTEIEVVSYKPEAVKAFEKIELKKEDAKVVREIIANYTERYLDVDVLRKSDGEG